MMMTEITHPKFFAEVGFPTEYIYQAQVLTLITVLLSSY
jgi:hypothetical protein